MHIEFPALIKSLSRTLRKSPRRDHYSLDLPLRENSRYSGRQAWEIALALLQDDMSRPVFQRWLSPVRLVRFDPAVLRFTAAVEDDQLRELLEERVAARLERHLLGVCGRPVQVAFVTWR